MNAEQIRHWLMINPRPDVVRCTGVEGQIDDVICGQSTWVRVSETIETMRPEFLQALSKEKNVLRAIRPGEIGDEYDTDEPAAPDPKQRRTPTNHAVTVPLAEMDPETKRLFVVAGLIADAYRHSTDVAFERLAELVEASNRRAEAVDTARESIYRSHVRQLEQQVRSLGQEPPEGPNDLASTMIGSLISGAFAGAHGGGAPAGAVDVPNGKGH